MNVLILVGGLPGTGDHAVNREENLREGGDIPTPAADPNRAGPRHAPVEAGQFESGVAPCPGPRLLPGALDVVQTGHGRRAAVHFRGDRRVARVDGRQRGHAAERTQEQTDEAASEQVSHWECRRSAYRRSRSRAEQILLPNMSGSSL